MNIMTPEFITMIVGQMILAHITFVMFNKELAW
jgi:hypothetical protein